MSIDWSRILPVLVSIVIIVFIAIIREYSKTIAAIAATMPINVPLGMWIVYAGADNRQTALADFSTAVLYNIFPTVAFIIAAWQLSRGGTPLVMTILLSYGAWAVCLGLTLLIRAQLGS